jgi:hypothetical protein
MGRECSTQEINWKCIKHEAHRPLGRSRRRWEDNIKIYLNEIGYNGVDWVHVAQSRGLWRALVNTEMKLGFH